MGGSVAFAVRKDGVVKTYHPSKHAASHVALGLLYEGQGEMHDFLQEHSGKEDFAPYGYGLVIMDFDQKWAAGIQGYTDLETSYVYFSRDRDLDELRCLWRQGRVGGQISNYSEKEKPIKEKDVEKYIARQIKEHVMAAQILVHPFPGWTVEAFDETEEGWEQFLAEIVKRGFSFSARDEAQWALHLQEHEMDQNLVGKVRSVFDQETLDRATKAAQKSSISKVRI